MAGLFPIIPIQKIHQFEAAFGGLKGCSVLDMLRADVSPEPPLTTTSMNQA
jgi:hypothetical protein